MLFINSFRILPVTIFAAALLVTVKISVLFDGSVMDHGPLQLSSADAQEAEKETVSDVKNEDAGPPKSDLADEKKGEGKEADNAGEGGADKVGEEEDDGDDEAEEAEPRRRVQTLPEDIAENSQSRNMIFWPVRAWFTNKI